MFSGGRLIPLLLAWFACANGEGYKVLLFGDSLTEGFTGRSTGRVYYHPYERNFTALFVARFPGSQVVQRGISGEMAVCPPDEVYVIKTCMGQRLPQLLREAQNEGKPYQYVVVLGGINDIGTGKNGTHVAAGLEHLYKEAEAFKVKVLAMTMFDTAACGRYPRLDVERNVANAWLRKYCEEHAASGSIALLDAEQAIPFRNATEQYRATNWDDGLHLTPQGYDMLGGIVFSALEKFITQAKQR